MAEGGWIKLYRKIQDHKFFLEKRVYSRFEAWIYFILQANHADKKILFNGNIIVVKRGSFITSKRKLCELFGWSNTKLDKFMEVLEFEEMITQKSDTKKTTITLVNYDLYNNPNDTETAQKHNKNDTETAQKRTNKNEKNEKKLKKKDLNPPTPLKTKFADFVSLTNDEYSSLVARLGSEERAKRCIEILDNYKGAKGATYKSDYRAILNWVIVRLEEEEQKGGRQAKPMPRGFATIQAAVERSKTYEN